MTSSSGFATPHFRRLLTIARNAGVQVHVIPGSVFPLLRWEGLYVSTPRIGAGIALRDDLETCWRDWILGHELGHHFDNLPGTLFSPFMDSVDEERRRRWGEWRRLDPREERANLWAVNTLVSAEAWDAAERCSPCDLTQVVVRLGLPFPAAVTWERQQRKQMAGGEAIAIPVSETGWQTLERRLRGQGGHQAFFERLVESRRSSSLMLTFYDFSLARERARSVKGGWLPRYKVVLDSAAPAIHDAGGVRALFKLDRCTAARTPVAGQA